MVLRAKAAQDVVVRYTAPGEGRKRVCHVRVTPDQDPDFSTYSTLTVRAGETPANRPLNMRLVLKPYHYENEQFGLLTDYPVENQVYFDLKNRPFTWTSAGPSGWRDGKWTATKLEANAGCLTGKTSRASSTSSSSPGRTPLTVRRRS